jgi:hypothetical protein
MHQMRCGSALGVITVMKCTLLSRNVSEAPVLDQKIDRFLLGALAIMRNAFADTIKQSIRGSALPRIFRWIIETVSFYRNQSHSTSTIETKRNLEEEIIWHSIRYRIVMHVGWYFGEQLCLVGFELITQIIVISIVISVRTMHSRNVTVLPVGP